VHVQAQQAQQLEPLQRLRRDGTPVALPPQPAPLLPQQAARPQPPLPPAQPPRQAAAVAALFGSPPTAPGAAPPLLQGRQQGMAQPPPWVALNTHSQPHRRAPLVAPPAYDRNASMPHGRPPGSAYARLLAGSSPAPPADGGGSGAPLRWDAPAAAPRGPGSYMAPVPGLAQGTPEHLAVCNAQFLASEYAFRFGAVPPSLGGMVALYAGGTADTESYQQTTQQAQQQQQQQQLFRRQQQQQGLGTASPPPTALQQLLRQRQAQQEQLEQQDAEAQGRLLYEMQLAQQRADLAAPWPSGGSLHGSPPLPLGGGGQGGLEAEGRQWSAPVTMAGRGGSSLGPPLGRQSSAALPLHPGGAAGGGLRPLPRRRSDPTAGGFDSLGFNGGGFNGGFDGGQAFALPGREFAAAAGDGREASSYQQLPDRYSRLGHLDPFAAVASGEPQAAGSQWSEQHQQPQHQPFSRQVSAPPLHRREPAGEALSSADQRLSLLHSSSSSFCSGLAASGGLAAGGGLAAAASGGFGHHRSASGASLGGVSGGRAGGSAGSSPPLDRAGSAFGRRPPPHPFEAGSGQGWGGGLPSHSDPFTTATPNMSPGGPGIPFVICLTFLPDCFPHHEVQSEKLLFTSSPFLSLCSAGLSSPGLWTVHSAPGPRSAGLDQDASAAALRDGACPFTGSFGASYGVLAGGGGGAGNMNSVAISGVGGADFRSLSDLWRDDSPAAFAGGPGAAGAGGDDALPRLPDYTFNPFSDQRA